jgi:hypothetical protein
MRTDGRTDEQRGRKMDRRTDGQDEANSRIPQFCERA